MKEISVDFIWQKITMSLFCSILYNFGVFSLREQTVCVAFKARQFQTFSVPIRVLMFFFHKTKYGHTRRHYFYALSAQCNRKKLLIIKIRNDIHGW